MVVDVFRDMSKLGGIGAQYGSVTRNMAMANMGHLFCTFVWIIWMLCISLVSGYVLLCKFFLVCKEYVLHKERSIHVLYVCLVALFFVFLNFISCFPFHASCWRLPLWTAFGSLFLTISLSPHAVLPHSSDPSQMNPPSLSLSFHSSSQSNLIFCVCPSFSSLLLLFCSCPLLSRGQ